MILISTKNLILVKRSPLHAFETIMLSPSVIKMNNKGGIGKSSLKLLEILKKFVGNLFIKTAKFADETHDIIQLPLEQGNQSKTTPILKNTNLPYHMPFPSQFSSQ